MNRLAAARNLLKVWLFLAAICALLGLLGWIAGGYRLLSTGSAQQPQQSLTSLQSDGVWHSWFAPKPPVPPQPPLFVRPLVSSVTEPISRLPIP